ncbi:MAG: penicillin-binding protein activator [Candidatus Symbiodolus clandestinus]
MLLMRLTTQLPRTILFLLLTLILLNGCQQSIVRSLDELYDPTVPAAEYLRRSQRSQATETNTWRLLAIRAWLQEGQLAQAIEQLEAFVLPLTPEHHREYYLLTLAIAIEQQDLTAAITSRSALAAETLSQSQQLRYYQLCYTLAQWQQDCLGALSALIALHPLLSPPLQAANQQQIWSCLTTLSPTEKQALTTKPFASPTLQGWLALFAVYETAYPDQQQRQQAIAAWCQQYPNHPAANQLPVAIIQQLQAQPLKLKKIGLLLPLNGPYAPYGHSLYQGFMQAAKQAKDQNTSSNSADTMTLSHQLVHTTPLPEIIIYDTTANPLSTLFTQAKQDQTSILVGPLRKQDVEQLNQLKVTIPLLALNVPQQPAAQPAIFYYGLTPNDETQEAARRLWRQKKQQPLLLIPRNEMGEKAAQAFQSTWQQLAGYPPTVRYFPKSAELKQMINQLSKQRLTKVKVAEKTVPVEMSETNEEQTLEETDNAEVDPLRALFAEPAEEPVAVIEPSQPAIDAIYMVATPEEFILLKALLDMSTPVTGRPRLYAGSRCLQSTIDPDHRLEMEGLQLVDIPLLITQQPKAIHQQAAKQCHYDFSLMRLYAMGYDAWALINHFDELMKLPYFQLSGLTGVLKADSYGIIHRQLSWARYHRGQRVALP